MLEIPPLYYHSIYIYVLMIVTLGYSMSILAKGKSIYSSKMSNNIGMFALCLMLTFFLGLRPHHIIFGDSVIYERMYYSSGDFNANDWLFDFLQKTASKTMSWEMFQLLIEAIYIMLGYIACRRLSENNSSLLVLFFLGAFSFYGGAVNGLRSGMAGSIVLLAITYLMDEKPRIPVFLILAVVASGIHKSILIPVGCVLFSYYFRKPKVMFYFWFLSIAISLVAGDYVTLFLTSVFPDDRFNSYLDLDLIEKYTEYFSYFGFRWDFLLYSFMPILLGWYVIFKRKIVDRNYYIMLATYIYANSFWVMVIRSPYSNRFAYLSWFLYPILLAYPLVKFPVFKDNHNKNTSFILVSHYMFTFIMYLISGYRY